MSMENTREALTLCPSAAWRGHAGFWRRIPGAGACPAGWEKNRGELRGFWLFGSSQPALTSGNNFVQEETLSPRLERAKQTEAPTLGLALPGPGRAVLGR